MALAATRFMFEWTSGDVNTPGSRTVYAQSEGREYAILPDTEISRDVFINENDRTLKV